MCLNPRWLVLVYISAVLFQQIIHTTQAEDSLKPQNEGYLSNKRAWKDVSGSWGKRGWNDLESTWGKRAWERMNGAWGKRLTLNPEASAENQSENDLVSEIMKRAEWNKFKGSWGKRAPEGDKTGWSNLKGLWGKRGWENLGNSWGKRSKPEYTAIITSENQASDKVHEVAEGAKLE